MLVPKGGTSSASFASLYVTMGFSPHLLLPVSKQGSKVSLAKCIIINRNQKLQFQSQNLNGFNHCNGLFHAPESLDWDFCYCAIYHCLWGTQVPPDLGLESPPTQKGLAPTQVSPPLRQGTRWRLGQLLTENGEQILVYFFHSAVCCSHFSLITKKNIQGIYLVQNEVVSELFVVVPISLSVSLWAC